MTTHTDLWLLDHVPLAVVIEGTRADLQSLGRRGCSSMTTSYSNLETHAGMGPCILCNLHGIPLHQIISIQQTSWRAKWGQADGNGAKFDRTRTTRRMSILKCTRVMVWDVRNDCLTITALKRKSYSEWTLRVGWRRVHRLLSCNTRMQDDHSRGSKRRDAWVGLFAATIRATDRSKQEAICQGQYRFWYWSWQDMSVILTEAATYTCAN